VKLFHLHELALNTPARIAAIDWEALVPAEAQRLRAFGFEAGADVELLHRAGLFARDPLACKIGRMTVALRRAVAAAIQVKPL
jgi:ferrous iron transport protein A